MKKLLLTGTILVSLFIFGCVNENNHYISNNDEANPNYENEHLSLLSSYRILNIAHRGASGHAPEHTLKAYKLGEKLRGDYIEIDLQMTKDGILIAMHDPDISRTSNKEGLVHELTLEEIKELDVGSWFNEQFPEKANPKYNNLTVPTLDEIITKFGTRANYYIETKQPEESPGMIEELVRVLKKHHLIGPTVREGQVIIQSFSKQSLKEINELEPSLPIIQLMSYQSKTKITDLELERLKQYAIGIGVNYKYLSKEYIKQVRDAEMLLHPYTVNEKADMELMIEWGATGMFTDYPDRLDEVLNEMESDSEE